MGSVVSTPELETRLPLVDPGGGCSSNGTTPDPSQDPDSLVVRHDPIYESIKRAMDIVGALMIGAVFLLLLPLLAIIIRLDSRGPIIYKQIRVGKDEQLFTIWKLRSMRSDAEKGGAQWASANDDRVTRFGTFMRKTRIDELPQFMNVLRGEMSLVGPRPERPEFVALLESAIPNYSLRHSVKPGITGLAQVQHSYAGSIADSQIKHTLDIKYIRERGIRTDLSIMLQTSVIIIRSQGR